MSQASSSAEVPGSQQHPPPVPTSKPPPLPTTTAPVVAGATRKQNIACDQCRTKKIRCLRADKTEICVQCKAKGSECTSEYIDSLANKKKKQDDHSSSSKRKRKKKDDESPRQAAAILAPAPHQRPEPSRNVSAETLRGHTPFSSIRGDMSSGLSTVPVDHGSRSASAANSIEDFVQIADSLRQLAQPEPSMPQSSSYTLPSQVPLPPTTIASFTQQPSPSEKQQRLFRYLFSAHPVLSGELGYTDTSSIEQCARCESDLWDEMGGMVWEEGPSAAHASMDDDALDKLVEELIEQYFSTVHPRYPFVDPATFHARLYTPNTHPEGALPHPLLATVIAWGARMSDCELIQADREECSARGVQEEGRKRSRLVQVVSIRTREVCESRKIWRWASMDNVRALLNLEGVLGQVLHQGRHYQATYASAAVKHLISLGYHSTKGVMTIKDSKERSDTIHIFWHVVSNDGYRAVFQQMKPSLLDEDYDLEPPGKNVDFRKVTYIDEPIKELAWFSAVENGASICRALALSLSSPITHTRGIPLTLLRNFIHAADAYQETFHRILHLSSDWPEDFLQVIRACAHDTSYHALWLVVQRAVEEYGVEDEKETGQGKKGFSGMGVGAEVEGVKKRTQGESEHAALRIAATVAVLMENGYLRSDPLIINQPIYEAGLYLAKHGKVECLACIVGLKQYSTTFPAIWSQVKELERVYENQVAQDTSVGQVGTQTEPNEQQKQARLGEGVNEIWQDMPRTLW
ncbi:hypothetical protein L202_01532 [Cryptococcus amylolentus CBS 6039]|uniref:Zn(2)-C6 fungal-type domain-containing protein n=1 Tax=Cryptococcus amylolentus CBS 6039 TaxID=1295533 RepID=A0A1E3I4C2_9TREE|nr:hypothetical protein L202_01532 [Cryptococcus amylolentus CBS 6039]ODN83388.1 hypothetical protein L202_01532 [Cryptococcus amylolentus CBS 6039]